MQLEKPGEFPTVLSIISTGKTKCSGGQEDKPSASPRSSRREGTLTMEASHSFPLYA